MEPAFHGERAAFECTECQQSSYLAMGENESTHASTCPYCGSHIVLQPKRIGDSIDVIPIGSLEKLKRFDCVVVNEPGSNVAEIKRFIGFPFETLSFFEGDLYVDGIRFEKSLPQFMRQAIPVKRWRALEKTLTPASGPVTYDHQSLWPQTTALHQAHPSPILDEYPMCPGESRWPVAVRDFGLRLALHSLPDLDTEVRFAIFDGHQLQRTVRVRWCDFSSRNQQVVRRTNQEPDVVEIDRSLSSMILVVAKVDGRLVVGNSDGWLETKTRTAAVECTETTPMVVQVDVGSLKIGQADVVRDIYYRGPHDEVEFALPAVLGYHLLGDNVAESSDSRQRWPQGVTPASLIGIVRDAGALMPDSPQNPPSPE